MEPAEWWYYWNGYLHVIFAEDRKADSAAPIFSTPLAHNTGLEVRLEAKNEAVKTSINKSMICCWFAYSRDT